MNKRILVLDMNNLFISRWYADPSMSTDGQPIGGLKGVLKTLQKLCREAKPDKVVACWDGSGGSKKRKLINKDYKEGRKPLRLNRVDRILSDEEEKQNRTWQMVRLMEYINNIPVLQYAFDHLEADDLISFVVQLKEYKDWQKIIVSDDKDFYQLLDNKTVVYRAVQKEILNKKDIVDKFEIHPLNFVVARSMVGDSSDNLPGVTRVGMKTVKNRFSFLKEEKSYTMDDVFEYCKKADDKYKVYQSILEEENKVRMNYKIMQLSCPMISAMNKEIIREVISDFVPTFNKTEFKKMMHVDGFGNYDWTSLYQNMKRITLDTQ